jgi:hypothetical protein
MAEFQKPDKDKAVFKLLVIFKDGAKRTYYNYHTSYNAERKKVIIDESVALKKLERVLIYKFANKYISAIIIHRPSTVQIMKYCGGRKIQDGGYSFQYQPKDDSIRIKLTN